MENIPKRSTDDNTARPASVGILMLETRFPRILGDIGNPQTWPFPVHYRVVQRATAGKVVCDDPRSLTKAFIKAGRELVQMGCDGITTSCGFLSLIQDEVKDALGVPVATSSLMQVPMIHQLLPKGRRVGILTISANTLTPAHLVAAGAPEDTPVMGTDNGRYFSQAILSDTPELDIAACRLDLINAAQSLIQSYPDVGAIVLECTNMAPYAHDIHTATGLPVFSIYNFVSWFQSGLSPRGFAMKSD